jgi:GNAT superfamily N-acetyltransferase
MTGRTHKAGASSRRYGKLVLALHNPETKEVFMLREASAPASALTRANIHPRWRQEAEEVRTLNLMRLGDRGEERIGHATYVPLKESIYIKYLETGEGHRERGVASSLLAYIKTHGKDMWLHPNIEAKPFYRNLGFSESPMYEGLALHAGKPLAGPGKGFRKFLVTGKKR